MGAMHNNEKLTPSKILVFSLDFVLSELLVLISILDFTSVDWSLDVPFLKIVCYPFALHMAYWCKDYIYSYIINKLEWTVVK